MVDVKLHSKILEEFIPNIFNHPIKMAEVGVHKAKNARYLLRTIGKYIQEYWGIDKYDSLPPAGITFQFRNNTDENWNMVYLNSCKYMTFFPQFRLIRATSKEAVNLFPIRYFPDGYFDFVYIDADHRYEAVREDIYLWYPLVKYNGWIAGHDYGFPENVVINNGVKRAVDEIFRMTAGVHEESGVWTVNKNEDTLYIKE